MPGTEDWDERFIEREFDDEFLSVWDQYRATPKPFTPRPTFTERVIVVSVKGNSAIIKRMAEDGEIYHAEVPRSDLNFGD